MEKLLLIICIIFIVVGTLFWIIFSIIYSAKKKKYTSFVLEHSLCLRSLEEINKKYSFNIIPDMDLSHSYDNVDFWSEISCKDYLTYQLVYIRKQVAEAANATIDNKILFKKYLEEIKEKCKAHEYDVPVELKNSRYLSKIEINLFIEKCLKPVTEFTMNVNLFLINIRGYYKSRKSETFGIEDIRVLIHRIKNQRNGYYLDRGIWDSICRVERGKVSNKMRFSIYERDGYRCCKCGSRYNLEIDHIIPISRGGKSTYDNLQTLCHRCNVDKGSNLN